MTQKAKKPRRIVVALYMGNISGRELLTGIFRHARDVGNWDIQLVQLPDGFRKERIERAQAEGIDGLILCSLYNPELRRLVDETDAPLVYVGAPMTIARPLGGAISVVDCDNYAIGAMGARHFLSLGSFNSFGYIHAGGDADFLDLREKGYRETIEAAGKRCLTLEAMQEADGRFDRQMIDEWLSSLPKPCAVMAFYDVIAAEVLKSCTANGLSVPAQVSVIGVDNDSLVCDFTTPPLTSVQPNHERAGFMAARELEALMSRPSHKPRSEICHGLHLVERESTRPMPPSASLVRRARSFIHAAAARGIGVEDVARHLGVSRRLVDLRFREVEGRTVHEAIEDRRLGIAEKLLSETSWTVRRIAAESGYRNVKTFEVAFRKRTGRLPGSARQASRDRKQISLHAKRTRP